MNSRELRALRKDKIARKFAALSAEPVFEVDGLPIAQSEFIAANADDQDVVEWARTAPVGSWFPSIVDRRRSA